MMDPKPVITIAADAANITVTPFSFHLVFGATRSDGETVPQGSVMISIAFGRFLHRLLGEAIDAAGRAPTSDSPGLGASSSSAISE